jgi:pyrimidine deaminase RibD-like protein
VRVHVECIESLAQAFVVTYIEAYQKTGVDIDSEDAKAIISELRGHVKSWFASLQAQSHLGRSLATQPTDASSVVARARQTISLSVKERKLRQDRAAMDILKRMILEKLSETDVTFTIAQLKASLAGCSTVADEQWFAALEDLRRRGFVSSPTPAGPFVITVQGKNHVRFFQRASDLEDDDRRFAQMAIEEALKSVPEDERPHPQVGSVVVKAGKVLSRAHRGESPKSHAEYIALEQKLSDDLVAGATVYTTLEPCTTRKHPKIPCAQRLVDRRVARVVIGMLDPNPEIRGLGEQLLGEAGIETQLFPRDLKAQVEEMNRDFIREQKRKRPRSGMNMSSSDAATLAARSLIDAAQDLKEAVWSFYEFHTRYRTASTVGDIPGEEKQILENIDSALRVFTHDYDLPPALRELLHEENGRIAIAICNLKEFAISVQEPDFKTAATQVQDACERIRVAAKPHAYRSSN